MFCKRSNKKSLILEGMSKCDGRYHNTLVIHTCYLDNDFSCDDNHNALNDFIAVVRRDRQYLKDVRIYIDGRTAKKNAHNLIKWRNSKRGIDISIYAVRCDKLFHSKAYALIAFDEDNQICSGGLVIGSGNLTNNGIGIQNGNIESFLKSNDLEELESFWKNTQKLDVVSIDEIAFNEESVKEFVVNEGCLLHIWNDEQACKQYLSTKYELTKYYQERIQKEQIDVSTHGFKIDHASISKNYIAPLKTNNSIDNWKTNYLVETYLGYWIPKSVFYKLTSAHNDEFDSFKERFFEEVQSQLEDNKKIIIEEYSDLLNKKVIKPLNEGDPDPFKKLQEKIDELRRNETKLKRIYYRYSEFDFPYDSENKEIYLDKVDEFYNDLMDTAKARLRKNKTIAALLELEKTNNRNIFNEIDVEGH